MDTNRSQQIKSLPPDPQWIQTWRRILRNTKDQVRRHLGPEPKEIRNYGSEYKKEFARRWRVSDKTELLERVLSSRVVFGGDFHAFSQAQRTHLKILRSLPADKPVILAMEAFSLEMQSLLDLYCRGKLSEASFLRKTQWDSEWGFPWDGYRSLLELAKMRNYRVVGVGHRGTRTDRVVNGALRKQDAVAARIIVSLYQENPDHLIYVVFGDLHLARGHLPAAVRKELGRSSLEEVIVYQNSERIYFQLARKGLETQVDVVRLNRNHFCVISSPPWVKWQSYLMFLEKTSYLDPDDQDDGSFDYTDQISEMMRHLCRDFGVRLKADDVAVYSSQDDRIWRYLKDNLNASELRIAKELIATEHGIFIPKGGIFYLAWASVNHAAELAGQYIHSKMSRRMRCLWNMPEDFEALIWVEAVGFFASKLVNHKRQADTLIDLKHQLAALHAKDRGREALLLALDQKMIETLTANGQRTRRRRMCPRQKLSYFVAARILGGMLGERLYLAFRSRRLSIETMVALMKTDVTGDSFSEFYLRLLRGFGPGTVQLKSKKERL